jgi:methionyl-tRNA synthetase
VRRRVGLGRRIGLEHYADLVRSTFYVTTPIYYVTDRPHLGTAYTMVLADALARWHRLAGGDVLFLTGTDEHGLKVVRAAEVAEKSAQTWVDETSAYFSDAWRALGISNDDFIRTTEKRHEDAVVKFLQAIYDNGYIYKGAYAGWYCVSCEAYYHDDELVDGHLCPIHGTEAEWMTEENYFFALSRLVEQLEDWYASVPDAVVPEIRRNEALGLIRTGLDDVSISRTAFDWGVRVPWDEEHVVYVWFDALINYVTAAGYGTDDAKFAKWWPVVHHVIGKDIVRFHCVWWPAMCLAAGIAPPRQVLAHGWLLVAGEKMSKSKANQVDPVELAGDVGLDPLRYHLLRDIAFGNDGDFSYEGMIDRYNADLANNLGNLLQRVSTVVHQKCDGIGPHPRRAGSRLSELVSETALSAAAAWERSDPKGALEATWQLIRDANTELESSEPWKLPQGETVEAILGDALEVLRIVAVLVVPAMPQVAAEIWRRLGLPGEVDEPGTVSRGALSWGGYPGGLSVEKGAPLFPRRRAAAS